MACRFQTKDLHMKPLIKHDLIVRSAIVTGEKPNKALDAVLADNPNKMNRLTGFLVDGRKVVISQRHGKGGMDFNKLTGGKVYAVAADGLSAVYEKDAEGKPTKEQKQEDGLPLFSSSGFYSLSSKEYPALHMMGAFTRVAEDGDTLQLVTPDQLKAKQIVLVETEDELADLLIQLEAALSDEHNLVAKFDAHSNKKRKRGIDIAKVTAEDAEDAAEKYTGVEFTELKVSPKDGNPMVVFSYSIDGGALKSGAILRQMLDVESEHSALKFLTAADAMEEFQHQDEYHEIANAFDELKPVSFGFAVGHVMRTSVSFRRKVENINAEPADKVAYGDAVYVKGAIAGWTKGLVTVLHSMHPAFPAEDYDAHHYVAAPRQAEVGMNKKASGDGYQPPEALHYNLEAELLTVSTA